MKVSCFEGALLIAFLGAVWTQGSGLNQRVANSSLAMPPSPLQFGYTVNNAFPGLPFTGPVCMTSPPGETNRLFILERGGNIVVITNLAVPNRTVFMNLPVLSDSESGLLGLAFHPAYAANGYFFVFSTRNLNTSQGNGRHQRISRFQVSSTNPNQALPATELPLITQYDTAGNHNGGDLHFGPEGYLYASLGDEGAQYNGNQNSQKLTKNFFSAILRLDVDKRLGNLSPNPHPAATGNYAIPSDNPYIGLTSFNGQAIDPTTIRTEFYAIGFRNPWRMSFDQFTGLLYAGDVGQDLYEEVDVITKGGNYGWAYYEGRHLAATLYPNQSTILKNPPAGLIDPIQEYPHSGDASYRGNAVIGGVVYRGSRLAQLYGGYVFADNGSGNVWLLRYDGANIVPFQRIAGATSPAAFGTDPRNGDILIAQLNNTIGRLDYNTTSTGTPLPATLADTGAFSDLSTLTPNPGIVPYQVNVPFWSDNAEETRWFCVPNINSTIGFNPEANWSFPAGTVWIQHFELEMTKGVPQSRQRLETRFIVRNANGVYGVTYRWDSPTHATLVPEEGLDEALTVQDGGSARTQIWHYPSRAECLACHTVLGGLALGFNTAQLNKVVDYGAGPESQIAALNRVGYFSPAAANFNTLRSLAHPKNTAVSVEYRVHSYLTANCSQCHQPGGTAIGFWDARATTPVSQGGIVKGPLVNDSGDSGNHVISPGSLPHSVLLGRISMRGNGQMPPLASTLPDTDAVNLLSDWITNALPGYQSFADWQLVHFGTVNNPNAALDADPDGDGADNWLEYLTGTDPLSASSVWNIQVGQSGNAVEITFPQLANRGFPVEWAVSLLAPVNWQPLDVPGNRPLFPASGFTATIADPFPEQAPKFYRVRVLEP